MRDIGCSGALTIRLNVTPSCDPDISSMGKITLGCCQTCWPDVVCKSHRRSELEKCYVVVIIYGVIPWVYDQFSNGSLLVILVRPLQICQS